MRLDRVIDIFFLRTNEDDTVTKVHLTKSGTGIKAYFRYLSASESATARENGTDANCQFTINRRKITTDMFISFATREFGTQTFKVMGIDPYDEHSLTMDIRCKTIEHQVENSGEEWPS